MYPQRIRYLRVSGQLCARDDRSAAPLASLTSSGEIESKQQRRSAGARSFVPALSAAHSSDEARKAGAFRLSERKISGV